MIERFLKYLAANGSSENTIKNYKCDLESLQRGCGKPLEKLKCSDIENYMLKNASRSKATMRRRHFSAKSFYNWAVPRELCDADPLKLLKPVKLPQATPRPLTPEEAIALLDAIPEHRIMDKLLFMLLLDTGIRISEALNLSINDVDLTEGDEKIFITVKGGGTRAVHIFHSERVVALLKRFITAAAKQTGYVFSIEADGWQGGSTKGGFEKGGNKKGGFQKRRNQNIGYATANRRFALYSKEAGIEGKNGLHTLRHTAATNFLRSGVDITVVQRMLNHSSPTITMRYTQVGNQFIRDQLSKMAM